MKRSAFLWITGVGAALLGAVEFNLRRPADTRSERYMAGAERYMADTGRPGRCHAARSASRWSGYTRDDLLA
jgi:hypothetical protein